MAQNKNLSAWEKMQLDMIYDDFDEDLFNRRVDAKNIFKVTTLFRKILMSYDKSLSLGTCCA